MRVEPIELEAPDVAQQLLLGEHACRLARERAQQRELLRRQLDLALAASRTSRDDRVDPKLADLKRALLAALRERRSTAPMRAASSG